jgi:hypothetical protein
MVNLQWRWLQIFTISGGNIILLYKHIWSTEQTNNPSIIVTDNTEATDIINSTNGI